MEAKDKSDGRGCIGCAVETGKVCKGCTHEGDLRAKFPPKGSTPNPSGKCQHKSVFAGNEKMMKDWGYKTIPLA